MIERGGSAEARKWRVAIFEPARPAQRGLRAWLADASATGCRQGAGRPGAARAKSLARCGGRGQGDGMSTNGESQAEGQDEVRRFVARLAPAPVCDRCIAERLELGATSAAAARTAELAGSAMFERLKAACSLCGVETSVIRKA
jgi:hypothetical protein